MKNISGIIKAGVCIGAAAMVFCSMTYAEDVYQTNRYQMIEELNRKPVKKMKTRGLTRGFTPGVESKMRAIKVMERIDEKVEEKQIMVDVKADVPKLKVKIEFDVNSARLKPESYSLLKEVGFALMDDSIKQSDIMINGHTDSDGSDAHNLRLSFERAQAVKDFLVSVYGVDEKRLKIRGYGEMLPIKPNNSALNKQYNRRVEFQVAE